MIHSIYTMTIRRYSEMKQTDNVKLLRKWSKFDPQLKQVAARGRKRALTDKECNFVVSRSITIRERVIMFANTDKSCKNPS